MSNETRPRRARSGGDIAWLARLTHPLVLFGAIIAGVEVGVATALSQKRSDETVIWIFGIMAVVVLAIGIIVAFLVVKHPRALMLTQQETIGADIDVARRARKGARILMSAPKPRTATELFSLLDQIERALSGNEER